MCLRGMCAAAAAASAAGWAMAAASDPDYHRALEAELLAATRTPAEPVRAMSPTIFGHVQVRYTATIRDAPPAGEEDLTQGFSMRAVRVGAKGGDDLSYFVLGDVSKSTGVVILLDACAAWRLSDRWSFQAGQFKLPLVYEECVSDTKQLAADRSLATQTVNQDRSQAIQATYDRAEGLRGRVAFSNGIATKNTDFDDPGRADYAFSGRVDWKPAGAWDNLADFTSEQDGAQAVRFGLFGHWQDGGSTGATADRSLLLAGADAQWEGAGWNAFGAATWAHTEPQTGPATDDLTLLGHAGYRLDVDDEIFARASAVFADDRAGFSPENIAEILVGYNHYLDGHRTKFTLDGGVFTAPTSETLRPSDTEVGILPDDGEPQVVIRAQVQITF